MDQYTEDESKNSKGIYIDIPASAGGANLRDYLRKSGINITGPCGGRGACGKCKVKVISGAFNGVAPDSDGFIKSCSAVCGNTSARIFIPSENIVKSENIENAPEKSLGSASGPDKKHKKGIALDIGTTTLAAALVDVEQNAVLATVSRLNPQCVFGADVISRISACGKGHLKELQNLVLDEIKSMISCLTSDFPEDDMREFTLTVSGNTTMLHLLLGISPEKIGVYPFTPEFTGIKEAPGEALGLPVKKVICLPSVSAYIGSDITAGMYATGIGGDDKSPKLLMDIGTNGEMILESGGVMYGCATAAGPAFEGANISCGMGGVPGAISSVSFSAVQNAFTYKTISNSAPKGLCGSGLLDFAAAVLEAGIIDETGIIDDGDSDEIALADSGISLTQKDIRELQLAKSAIRAGIESLFAEAGTTANKFVADGGRVFLAGGLGFYLKPESAASIGMLPKEFIGVTEAVGNTSLLGAIKALTEPDALEKLTELSNSCKVVSLESSRVFNEEFINNMYFPENDMVYDVIKRFIGGEIKCEGQLHQYAFVSPMDIPFGADVRKACEANLCGMYNKTWTCPPGVGKWEELREKLQSYANAFVYTTKHPLEDSFDIEGMEEGRKIHHAIDAALHKELAKTGMPYIICGAEGCIKCKKCTYPDAPCRFPEAMSPSMEACGINVVQLSKIVNINYINGVNTVTYFSAIFFN